MRTAKITDQTVSRDRVTQLTTSDGTIGYGYTGGHLTSVDSDNTDGTYTGYGYNALGMPTTVTSGGSYRMGTDGVGNVKDMTYPNGAYVTYGLNSVSRLTNLTYTMGTTTLGSFAYTLGAAGNRIGVSENGPAIGTTARNVVWTPDDLYRLTNESMTGDYSGGIGHVYDTANNRLTKSSTITGIPSQDYTGQIDATDRITATGYSWDDNGNMLTDSRGMTYTYNGLNRLTRVQGTSVDVSYLYNGDGLRVQKTNNLTGVVTRYLWDVNNVTGYPQAVEELQGGSVVRRYAYGPSGIISQTQKVGEDWVTSYFVRDATGTVRALMAEDGTISDVFSWTAWGELLEHVGSTHCALGLHGEYTESETGLVYLRARWYHPDLGRFMGMDAVEGNRIDARTLHAYSAFWNNPVNVVDPSGNFGVVDVSFALVGLSFVAAVPSVRAGTTFDEPTLPDAAFPPVDPRIRTLRTTDGTNLGDPRWIIKKNVLYTLKIHTINQAEEEWEPKFEPNVGEWDYKKHGNTKTYPKDYQTLANFGNFNFGVVGSALRIYGLYSPSPAKLREKGGKKEREKYEKDPTLGPYPYDETNPYTKGDRPEDSIWIDVGAHYWRRIDASYHDTIEKIRRSARR